MQYYALAPDYDEPADEAEAIEKAKNITAQESRRQLRSKILARYTAPE